MKIFIWGASGQGRVVLDILSGNKNFEIAGFIDSDEKLKGKSVDGVKVFGGRGALDDLKKAGVKAGIVAIGNNTARFEISNLIKDSGFDLVSAIHPRSSIASNASIGKNVTIAAGAIICAHAVIEDNVIINTGAIIEHENIIRNGAHVASGARLAGRVQVGERSFIGIGSTIIQCLKIGSNSIIGAGAVVLEDVPEDSMAVGIPSKVVRKVTKEDLLRI